VSSNKKSGSRSVDRNPLIFMVRNARIELAAFSSGGFKIAILPRTAFFYHFLKFNNINKMISIDSVL